jgi:hypothetical protein
MLHEEISSNGSLSLNEPRPETARRIVADVGLDVFSRVAQPTAAHYFKLGQAVGCDKQRAGTPIRSKNGVPALRLSHPTKYSDSKNALPCRSAVGEGPFVDFGARICAEKPTSLNDAQARFALRRYGNARVRP